MSRRYLIFFFFFFNDTATTEIYTLSLHDALPISFSICAFRQDSRRPAQGLSWAGSMRHRSRRCQRDRKSTRLNSSHDQISYAVFCLKKKKKKKKTQHYRLQRSARKDYDDATTTTT